MSFTPYPRNYRNGSVVIDNAQIGENSTTLTSHTHFDKSIELNRTYGGYRKYWMGMLGEGNKVNNVVNSDNSFGICVQPEIGSVAEPTVLLELNKDGDLRIRGDLYIAGEIVNMFDGHIQVDDISADTYKFNNSSSTISSPDEDTVLISSNNVHISSGDTSDAKITINKANNSPTYTLDTLRNKGVINFPQTVHDFSAGHYLPYIEWANATDDGDGTWKNICSIGTYKRGNGVRGSLYFAVNADDVGFINDGTGDDVSNVMTLTGGTTNGDRGRLSVPGDIYLQDGSKLLLGTGGNIYSHANNGMIYINCGSGSGSSGLWVNSGSKIQSFIGLRHSFSGPGNEKTADVDVAGNLRTSSKIYYEYETDANGDYVTDANGDKIIVRDGDGNPVVLSQDGGYINSIGSVYKHSHDNADLPSKQVGQIGALNRNNDHLHILADTSMYLRAGTLNDGDDNDNLGTINMMANEVHISSGDNGNCTLILEADTDNNNEGNNPMILFRQDGYGTSSVEEGVKDVDWSMIGQGNVQGSNNALTLANGVAGSGGIVFKTGNKDENGWKNSIEVMRITSSNIDLINSENNTPGNVELQNESKLVFGTGGHIRSETDGKIFITAGDNNMELIATNGIRYNANNGTQKFIANRYEFWGTDQGNGTNGTPADVNINGDLSVAGSIQVSSITSSNSEVNFDKNIVVQNTVGSRVRTHLSTTQSWISFTTVNDSDIENPSFTANIGYSSDANRTLHITTPGNIWMGFAGVSGESGESFSLNGDNLTSSVMIRAPLFYTTSDYRTKTNIEELDENVSVSNLRPIMYLKKGKKEIGLIAHELQEVYPFMVSGEKDGKEMQSVNYNCLIGVLINDVKRLTNENEILKLNNDTLKSDYDTLKSDYDTLKSRLDSLEEKFNKKFVDNQE